MPKFRVLTIRTNNIHFNALYVTAFEIQRPWKIEGERFSSDTPYTILHVYDPIPCIECGGLGCPDCLGYGAMSGLGYEGD